MPALSSEPGSQFSDQLTLDIKRAKARELALYLWTPLHEKVSDLVDAAGHEMNDALDLLMGILRDPSADPQLQNLALFMLLYRRFNDLHKEALLDPASVEKRMALLSPIADQLPVNVFHQDWSHPLMIDGRAVCCPLVDIALYQESALLVCALSSDTQGEFFSVYSESAFRRTVREKQKIIQEYERQIEVVNLQAKLQVIAGLKTLLSQPNETQGNILSWLRELFSQRTGTQELESSVDQLTHAVDTVTKECCAAFLTQFRGALSCGDANEVFAFLGDFLDGAGRENLTSALQALSLQDARDRESVQAISLDGFPTGLLGRSLASLKIDLEEHRLAIKKDPLSLCSITHVLPLRRLSPDCLEYIIEWSSSGKHWEAVLLNRYAGFADSLDDFLKRPDFFDPSLIDGACNALPCLALGPYVRLFYSRIFQDQTCVNIFVSAASGAKSGGVLVSGLYQFLSAEERKWTVSESDFQFRAKGLRLVFNLCDPKLLKQGLSYFTIKLVPNKNDIMVQALSPLYYLCFLLEKMAKKRENLDFLEPSLKFIFTEFERDIQTWLQGFSDKDLMPPYIQEDLLHALHAVLVPFYCNLSKSLSKGLEKYGRNLLAQDEGEFMDEYRSRCPLEYFFRELMPTLEKERPKNLAMLMDLSKTTQANYFRLMSDLVTEESRTAGFEADSASMKRRFPAFLKALLVCDAAGVSPLLKLLSLSQFVDKVTASPQVFDFVDMFLSWRRAFGLKDVLNIPRPPETLVHHAEGPCLLDWRSSAAMLFAPKLSDEACSVPGRVSHVGAPKL